MIISHQMENRGARAVLLALVLLLLLSACNSADVDPLAEEAPSDPDTLPGESSAAPPASRSEQPEDEPEPEPGQDPEPETEPETEPAESEPESVPPQAQSEPETSSGQEENALDIGSLPAEVAERMVGSSWDEDCPVALSELRYLTIPYLDFEGVERVGEMVVHHSLADEVEEIFAELFEARFPIAGMRLVDDYGADDARSMEANNSYCFCSRLILGTARHSVHSYGSAVDINPVQNPYCVGEAVYPAAAEDYLDRDDVRPGMIVEGDAVHSAFVSRGWRWGGDWPNPDYQHFEKSV